MKYVALLRGINVGKSVQVPMGSLKRHFEDIGISGVTTYLNTGNVIFNSELTSSFLQNLIESELFRIYGQRIPTLVKTSNQMTSIVKAIPIEWGSNETEQTYVAYLFKEAARSDIVDELPVRKEFMSIFYTHECIVWNIKRENYNRSHITKIVQHSAYGLMTTRNINTARKLSELCEK